MFSLLSTLYRVPIQNHWKLFLIQFLKNFHDHERSFFLIFSDFNEVKEKILKGFLFKKIQSLSAKL